MSASSLTRMRRSTRDIGEYIERLRPKYIREVPLFISINWSQVRFKKFCCLISYFQTKNVSIENLRDTFVKKGEHYRFAIFKIVNYENDVICFSFLK